MKTEFKRLVQELSNIKEKMATKLEGNDLLVSLENEGNILVCIEKEFDKLSEYETR